MCELAADEERDGWLMVDPWEATQSTYIPTAKVLDHFQYEINEVLGGAERPDGTRVPMRIILLAGADLMQTMSTPGKWGPSVLLSVSLIDPQGVWSSDDLDHILRGYGAFIVEREGTDIDNALSALQIWRDNIYVSITAEHIFSDSLSCKTLFTRKKKPPNIIPCSLLLKS